MINETDNPEFISPSHEADRSPEESSSLSGLGRKGLAPILSVLGNHRNDLAPYIEALTKALKSGADSLGGETAGEAEKFIAQYFHSGLGLIDRWKEQLGSRSPEEVIRLLEEEGRKHPALMFGVSYIAGTVLGRVGRHLGKSLKSSTDTIH